MLLDKTPTDGTNTEKKAVNNIGLAGFEVIDTIKQKVGADASCADILAFAGRDAADILSGGKIFYTIPGGRKDGVVSSAAAADANLPESTFDFGQLQTNFAAPGRNFTVEELVILSGAHSIGQTHCSSFAGRLSEPADQIKPAYRELLKYKCSQGSNPTVDNNVRDENYDVVARYTPGFTSRVRKVPDYLDNSYYHNNLAKIVTFHSDWTLLTDKEAFGHVKEYAENGTLWDEDFADSLVKLSKLPMPAGSKGEIRKKCSVINHRLY